jgi:Bacterial Ig-like domain (group 2)
MKFDESRRSNLLGLASLALAATVPGCGGGGGGSGEGGAAASVVALELAMPASTVSPGQSVSLVATVRFSDGTSTVVTGEVNWLSSNPAAATVSVGGRVTAVAEGSTIISASYQSTTASLSVRVGEPLQSLEILPLPFRLALGIGGTWQLFTLAHSASNTSDVKSQAVWSSSDPGVATVGQGSDGGLVRGVSVGAATITCTLDGLAATAQITVLAHQRIAHSDTDVLALQCTTAVDTSGRAMAVWTRWFRTGGRPDLSWSQYRAGTGWSAEASLRPLPLAADARSSSPVLSLQDGGTGWAAWQQPDGLFAAGFNPSTGWSAPVLVDPTGTFFGDVGSPLALQVDRSGNALLVWKRYSDGATRFWFSTLTGSTGLWASAAAIPGTQMADQLRWWKLVTNKDGAATLLWAHAETSLSANRATVMAVRWQPVTGAAGQWLAPETLLSGSELPDYLAACMDDAGATLIGWIQATGQTSTAGRSIDTLRSRRHLPGLGWQTEQVLIAATDLQPRQLAMAAAAGHGAGALWANSWDSSVQAARMSSDGSWTALGEASDDTNPLAQVGDPSQLEASQLNDGRLIFSWLASDNLIGGALATRVHHPSSGWAPLRRDTSPGRVGSVLCMSLTYSADGLEAAVWLDANQTGSDLFGFVGWQP